MPLDIEALLAEAELPETSVTLCLKGNLVSSFEALDAALQHLPAAPSSLAGDSEAVRLAAELEQLRAQMKGFERVFSLRALPAMAFATLRAAQPEKGTKTAEEYAAVHHDWVVQIVAGTCYDPEMTPEQVDRLCGVLSDGQWRKLSNEAWSVNTDNSSIPFSVAGYVLTQNSAARSPQPDPPASPDHGSLAGPSEPSPSTSTPTDG